MALAVTGCRLEVRLTGLDFDWQAWCTDREARGAAVFMTDADTVYRPTLRTTGLERQPCTMPRQHTVARWHRRLDTIRLTTADRCLSPPAQGLLARGHDLVRGMRNSTIPPDTNLLGWSSALWTRFKAAGAADTGTQDGDRAHATSCT